MKFKCFKCGQGIDDGIALYRQNPKGELPAIWACSVHDEKKSERDPLVEEVTAIIESDGKTLQ